ncbi:beta-ketoacyl synthase chain length factor [Haliea sp. E1-2-M8]|uniref:beta-ketoacyl synthase chain length factor n=1 Tax=Haliea sp. E1-2-M8 TaxID=3064706 RepID=UPI0027283EBF|nr:beta-ketoacyl synthase chain length factor [Haliea sp. E1-2-M8]MDO8861115.1 beta-ketoacyl synthase chain length factor [Haliea sp. E1-2-M8]
MAIHFAVSSWSGWTTGAADISPSVNTAKVKPILVSQTPDVSIVPPLLRRRLNVMGRACVSEMLRHLQEGDNPAVVYGSRHGDIERTLAILMEQARGEPISPMNFSLAVHNAITGVISIHQQISSNISSIAAGDEPLIPVLLEAAGLLSDTCPAILCVLCDVPLPEVYRDPLKQVPAPYVACFRITRDQGLGEELWLDVNAVSEADGPARTAPLDFVEFLSSACEFFPTRHNGSHWTVRKSRRPAGSG